jgi:hypothetical protein
MSQTNSFMGHPTRTLSGVGWLRPGAASIRQPSRLTRSSAGDPDRVARVIVAADLQFEAGDASRSVAILQAALEHLPGTGPAQAKVLLRLAHGTAFGQAGFREATRLLHQADAACGVAEEDMRTRIHIELARVLGQYDVLGAVPYAVEAQRRAAAVRA